MFWPKGYLVDGFWLLICGFKNVMFLLQDGGFMDLWMWMWRELWLKGGDYSKMINVRYFDLRIYLTDIV